MSFSDNEGCGDGGGHLSAAAESGELAEEEGRFWGLDRIRRWRYGRGQGMGVHYVCGGAVEVWSWPGVGGLVGGPRCGSKICSVMRAVMPIQTL